jgi:excinuclease UvrABC ATPase subunit
MPTLARPGVDLVEGLTTAILVGQERMGADARSTVGTVTDANAAGSGRSRSRRAPGRPRNACQAAHVTVARVPTRTAARFPTQVTLRRFL